MYTILVCDDEKEIVDAIEIYLMQEGYRVLKAYNGKEALEILNREEVHLVILDLMMPELDGIHTTLEIRKESGVPIIILSAKSQDADKILGLNIGADDYITKPFNPAEVIARVRSQLRRYQYLGGRTETEQVLTCGGIVLDDPAKKVLVDGEEVTLTPMEYGILKLLMEHPGKVYSTTEIYRQVWNDTPLNSQQTVAVHIRHLREKIEIDPAHPRYIKVIWGQGYKIGGDNNA